MINGIWALKRIPKDVRKEILMATKKKAAKKKAPKRKAAKKKATKKKAKKKARRR